MGINTASWNEHGRVMMGLVNRLVLKVDRLSEGTGSPLTTAN